MKPIFQALILVFFAVLVAFLFIYLYAYANMLYFFYNMITTVDPVVLACGL